MDGRGLPHVTEIQQRSDGTLSVYIQTVGFDPGQEVEVSAYLTQDQSYAFYNDKKRILFPDPTAPTASKQATQLHLEMPAARLNPERPVTVVTRVTEVWSTPLKKDQRKLDLYKGISNGYTGPGLIGVWTYQDSEENQDSEGK